MPRYFLTSAALTLLWLPQAVWATPRQPLASPAQTSPVVLLSDIHFDPLPSEQACATPEGKAVAAKLTESPAERWSAADFHLQGPTALGRDANYALMESALQAAHRAAPNARLVLVPGDLLAHSLNALWSACTEHPDAARFTRFAANTEIFVLTQIAAAFSGAQIVPTLGNNDSDRGDYAEPTPEFLRAILPEWKIVTAGGTPRRIGDFSAFTGGGYFAIALAGWPHLRVLSLNSNAWSAKFNSEDAPLGELGDRELQWLQSQLAAAHRAHNKVVLLGHIPPGLDAFTTRQSGGKRIVTFYRDCGELGAKPGCRDFANSVPAMMRKFSSTITMAIFGHTHQDEFRVVGEGATAIPLQIVPSVSPIFQNNPAFLVADAGPHFAWRDLRAWSLPLSGGKQEWAPEFAFDQTYSAKAWNVAALETLVSNLKTDNAVRKNFFLLMSSGNPAAAVPARWRDAYICGLHHLTAETVVPCVAESQLDLPLP